MSINTFLVAKKGHRRMKRNSRSSFMSRTIKSIWNVNFLKLTNTSSMCPRGYFTDLSAICSMVCVELNSPIPSLLKIDDGIRLTLAPKSHSASLKWAYPMVHRIVNRPRSFMFGGSLVGGSCYTPRLASQSIYSNTEVEARRLEPDGKAWPLVLLLWRLKPTL